MKIFRDGDRFIIGPDEQACDEGKFGTDWE
jgi:hypothetical protein